MVCVYARACKRARDWLTGWRLRQNDTVEKIKSVAMKHIEAADVYGDDAFAAPADDARAAEGVSLY